MNTIPRNRIAFSDDIDDTTSLKVVTKHPKYMLMLLGITTAIVFAIIARMSYESETAGLVRHSLGGGTMYLTWVAVALATWHVVFPFVFKRQNIVKWVMAMFVIPPICFLIQGIYAPRERSDELIPANTSTGFKVAGAFGTLTVAVCVYFFIPNPYLKSVQERNVVDPDKPMRYLAIFNVFVSFGVSIGLLFGIGVDVVGTAIFLVTILWITVVYHDRSRTRRKHKFYVFFITLAIVIFPMGMGTGVITLFTQLKDKPGLQLVGFIGWSLFMGVVNVLWRRTAMIATGGKGSEECSVSCSWLIFPFQLFDDMFSDAIFLNVRLYVCACVCLYVCRAWVCVVGVDVEMTDRNERDANLCEKAEICMWERRPRHNKILICVYILNTHTLLHSRIWFSTPKSTQIDPFSPTFFLMLLITIVKDVVRDSGVVYRIFDRWRKRQYNKDDLQIVVLYRFHIAEQNLFSEICEFVCVLVCVGVYHTIIVFCCVCVLVVMYERPCLSIIRLTHFLPFSVSQFLAPCLCLLLSPLLPSLIWDSTHTVAVVVIPVTILLDLFGNEVGFGVSGLTFGLEDKLMKLLAMYGVLFIAQICTHYFVIEILKRQFTHYYKRASISMPTNSIRAFQRGQKRRRKSKMLTRQSSHKHAQEYWQKNFVYCVINVVFVISNVIFFTVGLKHDKTLTGAT